MPSELSNNANTISTIIIINNIPDMISITSNVTNMSLSISSLSQKRVQSSEVRF